MSNLEIIETIEECITELQIIYKEINGYFINLNTVWQDEAYKVYIDSTIKVKTEYEKTIEELKKTIKILKMSKKKENENE